MPLTVSQVAKLAGVDPRFTENIDKLKPGLAAFTREAFRANAERAAG